MKTQDEIFDACLAEWQMIIEKVKSGEMEKAVAQKRVNEICVLITPMITYENLKRKRNN
jgi:hypothetical protein